MQLRHNYVLQPTGLASLGCGRQLNTALGTMKIRIISIVTVTLFLSACSQDWEGFVYPNKHDLTNHIGVDHHKSLEECRAASIAALNKVSSVERGDYECGLNCKADGGLGDLKVCEETLR